MGLNRFVVRLADYMIRQPALFNHFQQMARPIQVTPHYGVRLGFLGSGPAFLACLLQYQDWLFIYTYG
jgi:hypothetical protein